jgi:hypothetical protein
VVDLFDETSLQELADLFTDKVLPLDGLLPWLLSYQLASGWIFRWCSITTLGIPGICDGSQANTSIFARRKAMSVLSYFSPKYPPMRVVWEGSVPTWMVFTGTSSVSDG